MRKCIYSMMVSLDGFVAGPDQDLSWHVIDEELHSFANQQERELGASIYGRRMYELMSDFWPTADADPDNPPYVVEYAQIWKSTPIIVFSKTLPRVTGNATLDRGDAVEALARLKAQPGKPLSVGGATLAASFIQHGLVDEFQLFVQPVILGSGMRMFPELKDKLNLKLLETHRFGSGVVFLRYQNVPE